ncbi:MAG TPA: AAA family ATPase [Thermoanaerobacterales bacterium]|nr:AAA family ATPase [Thermoanaerobacterales bacterium]
MFKEISIGALLAGVIFLIIQGVNILPAVFILGIFSMLYFLMDSSGVRKKFDKIKTTKYSITFNEIGGQEVAKKELLEALDFIKEKDKIFKLGIRPLKGILFIGPPGTGKTLLAKAAANYIDSVFIATSGSEFIEMYAGVGAQRIRKLFDTAYKTAKREEKNNAVVFIDEIEVLAGKRGRYDGHLEYDQTLNQLLVEMDGISTDDAINILVIGATNRHDMLDPAILRPGRFDRIVRVDLPDKDSRLQILKIHTRNKKVSENVSLENIAKETFGFSGSHLESLANEAAIMALREGQKVIEEKHFHEAIDKVIMGEKLDRKPTQEEIYRIAVHETGHALLSEFIKPGSVSAITVTPRGNALGYMRQNYNDDLYLYTKEYIEDQITVLLAGSVAEEVLLGNRSTGASNDFNEAINLAKKMIFSGLSNLGIIDRENISPRRIHEAVVQIIKQQEERAYNYIIAKKDIINKIVDILIESEKIYGNEFRNIIRADCA